MIDPEDDEPLELGEEGEAPEPNADGHVEINTDAPRAGPVGDYNPPSEGDVIAEAAADYVPGDVAEEADEEPAADGEEEPEE